MGDDITFGEKRRKKVSGPRGKEGGGVEGRATGSRWEVVGVKSTPVNEPAGLCTSDA